MDAAPSVRALLGEATRRLAEAGVASPEHDAGELLAHVLGTDRGRLALHGGVGADAVAGFERLLARRAAREPLQHLLGRAWFRHVSVGVGPGVFVPRPETELLAGWAVEAAQAIVDDGRRHRCGRPGRRRRRRPACGGPWAAPSGGRGQWWVRTSQDS